MSRIKLASVSLDKIAEWSLYILIFVLPFSKSLVEITVVTGFLSLLIKKIINKERIFGRSWVDVLLYIWLAVQLLSFFNTCSISLSLRALFSKSIKFAILFLITKEIINSKTKLKNFIIMALLSCVVILIDAFIQHFITHVDLLHNYPSFYYIPVYQETRTFPTASFPFPNDFAAWMLMFIFPVGVFTMLGKERLRERVTAAALFVCLLYFFILTKARSAWLGFFMACGALTFFKVKKVVLFSLVGLILIIILMNRALIPDILSPTSLGDRNTMWKYSWEIFKKHPVIGNGLNTFYVNFMNIREDKYRGTHGSYAHNCYLQMAADIGLIGLTSFLVFLAALIGKGFRALRRAAEPYYSLILGINLGIIAFLIHSAFDTNLYSLNLSALFWVAAGLMLAVDKIAQANA